MGLDLNLLPMYLGGQNDACNFSHSVIECKRDSDLFDEILKAEKDHGKLVPEGFVSYLSRADGKEPHYGETDQSPYGEKLKYMKAVDLQKAMRNHGHLPESAYIAHLEADHKVVLYWC